MQKAFTLGSWAFSDLLHLESPKTSWSFHVANLELPGVGTWEGGCWEIFTAIGVYNLVSKPRYSPWEFGVPHFYSQIDNGILSLRAETRTEHNLHPVSPSVQASFSPLQCVLLMTQISVPKSVVNVLA